MVGKPLEYNVSRKTLEMSLWCARMSTQRSDNTIKVIECLGICQKLISLGRLGKNIFLNSEILGLQIWRKSVNDDKFETATKQRKSSTVKYTPHFEVILQELNLSIPSFRMIY